MNEKMTAIVNDQRLMDIARYKSTSGMLKIATAEDISKEFIAMKRRILSKRTTINKLEETVFAKYGIQEDISGMLPPEPHGQQGYMPVGAKQEVPRKKITGFSSDDKPIKE